MNKIFIEFQFAKHVQKILKTLDYVPILSKI